MVLVVVISPNFHPSSRTPLPIPRRLPLFLPLHFLSLSLPLIRPDVVFISREPSPTAVANEHPQIGFSRGRGPIRARLERLEPGYLLYRGRWLADSICAGTQAIQLTRGISFSLFASECVVGVKILLGFMRLYAAFSGSALPRKCSVAVYPV